MKKFLKISVLICLSCVFLLSLVSCEKNGFLKKTEYPESININESPLSSQLSGPCTDKEMIKAFIDMLDGCEYERVELSEDDAKHVWIHNRTYVISDYRVNIISDHNDTFVYVARETEETSSIIYPTEKYRVTSGFDVTPVESLKKDSVS